LALLRFAGANGFFIAAVFGLIRTVALTDYLRLRSNLGLTRYREAEVVVRLEATGFSVQRAPDNIGHNAARMTFLARPKPRPPAARYLANPRARGRERSRGC
jgi:hypothetical protein